LLETSKSQCGNVCLYEKGYNYDRKNRSCLIPYIFMGVFELIWLTWIFHRTYETFYEYIMWLSYIAVCALPRQDLLVDITFKVMMILYHLISDNLL